MLPGVATLKSDSLNVIWEFAGIVRPVGIRNFLGLLKSSVRYQPPMLAGVLPRLASSMVSVAVAGSVRVRASLMTTCGNVGGTPSSEPGEPLMVPLGRQLAAVP